MIRRVVLVSQGENDLGFLKGLRSLLGCDSVLTDYLQGHAELRQRGHYTQSRDARQIWRAYQGADLIVRLTDGDTDSPQAVYREECERWPVEARSKLVCGVCDRDVEHWMCLHPAYAASVLRCDATQIPRDRKDRCGFIKSRIDAVRGQVSREEFVARYVTHAPRETLRIWLRNRAFRHFHDQCRDKAQEAQCPVRNLWDGP